MITDQTLDESLIEIMRTKKALEALRKAKKTAGTGEHYEATGKWSAVAEHAATKRASMDLSRVLAKLRAGR